MKRASIDKELVEKLAKEGRSAKHISEAINCGTSTIHRYCKVNNIYLKKQPRGLSYIDMSGKTIHNIQIKHRVENNIIGQAQKQLANWLCVCHCGNEFTATGSSLRQGKIRTCGCRKGLKKRRNWKGYGDITGTVWKRLIHNAEQRFLDIDISIEYCDELFKTQNKRCALSGVPIEILNKKGTASLDRIDSSKGYIKDNVQWVHKDINKMKQSFTQAEFIEMCIRVSEQQ